ncbi:MAG: hypothetical protein PHE83_07625 [Opitutaceae bacterium]|nr:hypothetical protein [Opitutaceae bacterium]
MAIYSEYLETLKDFAAFTRERKKQLAQIAAIRGSDVLVIAAAIGKPNASIDYSDLIPIADQLESLKGEKLDVILETPGGSGETTEDVVRLLRRKHKVVNFIVPGAAKSAGTIMVMSGDDILMGSVSALGPIDAQVARDGKFFSAEAFLEGLKRIKEETDEKQALNRAYIPILQAISPGELEAARNALKFGKTLASNWLNKYKFSHWQEHSDKRLVTPDERQAKANSIADELCSHSRWLSHGRSITLEDLRKMGIRITNYEELPDLSDAIRRYHILLRMSFETNMFKIYETPTSQIFRYQGGQAPAPRNADFADIHWQCPKCHTTVRIQARFDPQTQLKQGFIPFPKTNLLACPNCGTQSDITALRMQIEAQTKKKII